MRYYRCRWIWHGLQSVERMTKRKKATERRSKKISEPVRTTVAVAADVSLPGPGQLSAAADRGEQVAIGLNICGDRTRVLHIVKVIMSI